MIDQRFKIIALFLLIAALVCFIMGLNRPIMGTELAFGLQQKEYFLVDTFQYFFKREEYFLGTILLLFTLILPGIKFIGLIFSILGKLNARYIVIMHHLNKWAMLDVFVVAILIMNIRWDAALMDQYILSGTRFFAGSILLLMLVSLCVQLGSKSLFDPDNSRDHLKT